MSMKFGYLFLKLRNEYEDISGKLVLEAYLDPTGVWTGPGGMTKHANGVPVKQGDAWTPDQAMLLVAQGEEQFAREVSAVIPPGCTLTQAQFDMLGDFAWNYGTGALANSSIIDALRKSPPRYEEAAAAFLLYRRARIYGGRPGPDGQPARGPDGEEMPIGVSWWKAFRGLYRRSAARACAFLGYDWTKATDTGFIALPTHAQFNAAENEWVDIVSNPTPWAEILDRARNNPLPPEPTIDVPEPDRIIDVMGKQVILPKNWGKMDPDAQTEWMNIEMRKQLSAEPKKGVTVATAKGKVVEAPKVDATKPPKAVEDSETVRGEVKVVAGKEAVKVAVAAGGATVAAGTADVVKDYMPVAKEMTGFLKGTDVHTILIAGGAFAGIMLLIGGWRWWRGAVIKWQGRQAAEGPKI